MIKCGLFRSLFRIALASVIGLSSCVQSPSSNTPVETQQNLNSAESNQLIQQLPNSEGIKLGELKYIQAKTTSNPALEKAILEQLKGYNYCQDDDTSKGIRYFYNLTDLNNDGSQETIVYLLGTYSCGSGGCRTLIFQSSGSDYQLISSISLVNNPIIISNQKTAGWHDLIIYVTGGGAKSDYHLLHFNGSEYPSNPSIQPSLASGSVIAGKALIANQIAFDTPAPIVQSENCESTPFELMKSEGFGELKIDLTAAQVVELLGSPETKDEIVLWEADGFYHQYWYYLQQGITLEMISATAGNKQKVASIKLISPSRLKTQRGIGIGDSYTEVIQAYQQESEPENSIPSKQFVAGSIYGGLIFSFQNGRVSEIFLGAAAE